MVYTSMTEFLWCKLVHPMLYRLWYEAFAKTSCLPLAWYLHRRLLLQRSSEVLLLPVLRCKFKVHWGITPNTLVCWKSSIPSGLFLWLSNCTIRNWSGSMRYIPRGIPIRVSYQFPCPYSCKWLTLFGIVSFAPFCLDNECSVSLLLWGTLDSLHSSHRSIQKRGMLPGQIEAAGVV